MISLLQRVPLGGGYYRLGRVGLTLAMAAIAAALEEIRLAMLRVEAGIASGEVAATAVSAGGAALCGTAELAPTGEQTRSAGPMVGPGVLE